ncbi:hypothetical protein SXIM_19520 [Streptomyces xiamenensis]|uniref:Uncharacterized protein n=1 Tax=Streptomyces xiamenensis TaxID=408015 RepID=A0A0F7CNQ8_9ACTN|nr:hypothetical protein SXIM_19520 [Streptomyces xiamenensis]
MLAQGPGTYQGKPAANGRSPATRTTRVRTAGLRSLRSPGVRISGTVS